MSELKVKKMVRCPLLDNKLISIDTCINECEYFDGNVGPDSKILCSYDEWENQKGGRK